MNKIAFLPDAEQEMISAAKFYESIAEGFGDDFLAEVKRALRSIQKNPDRWPVVEENIRKHRMNRFPYYIAYFIRDEVIIILQLLTRNADRDIGRTESKTNYSYQHLEHSHDLGSRLFLMPQ